MEIRNQYSGVSGSAARAVPAYSHHPRISSWSPPKVGSMMVSPENSARSRRPWTSARMTRWVEKPRTWPVAPSRRRITLSFSARSAWKRGQLTCS